MKWGIGICIAFVIGLIVLSVVLPGISTEGTVVEKDYTPSSTGTAVTGKGDIAVTSTPAEYTLFVGDEIVEVSKKDYVRVHEGDYVVIEDDKVISINP